jgi:serine/threonine protein phosphatase PrpC
LSVFDGHGGSKIANFVSKNLHKVVTKRDEYKSKDYTNALIQV